MSKTTNLEKYKDAVLMRQNGLTLQQIGDKFNVTREMIRLALNELCGIKYIKNVHKPKGIKNCLFCDKEMILNYSQMNKKFCSRQCKIKGMPRVIRTEEERIAINTERVRKYRSTERGKVRVQKAVRRSYKKYKIKGLARAKLNHHVKNGNIIKPDSCSMCNKTGYIHAHHEDYSKPLDVIWVCPKCHKDIHRGLLTVANKI